MKQLLTALLVLTLAGCASMVPQPEWEAANKVRPDIAEFNELPPPAGGKIVIAVYKFEDKTGQRKPSDKLANISYAVTQGADEYVIKALKDIGDGQWFRVVERGSLDHLTKERQIVRQQRDSVNDERQLRPLLFAGVLVEGAITGYDSNTMTGGAGARYLGIGPSTQYRQDIVTITMRIVSVQTGEILLTVSVTKTILSHGNSFTFFRFFDMGTSAAEAEAGHTINEPVNYAVRVAIEQAVVELVREGEQKNLWSFKPEIESQVDSSEGNNATENINSSSDTTSNNSTSK